METFPDEVTVTRWERLAHVCRRERAAAASVASAASPAAVAATEALTADLAATVGKLAAEWAVTDWILTDRPIADVAWWHRLLPGTPVVDGVGRVGVVVAGDPDGLAERIGEWLTRWVAWQDAPDVPVLVRGVDLRVVDG